MHRWLLCGLATLALLSAYEARTIRLMKADLERARQSRTGDAAVPLEHVTPEFRDEMQRTLVWLNDYYASPAGLGYSQGLCAGGRIDAVGVSTWIFATYLPLRISGASEPMARQKTLEALQAAVRGQPPG